MHSLAVCRLNERSVKSSEGFNHEGHEGPRRKARKCLGVPVVDLVFFVVNEFEFEPPPELPDPTAARYPSGHAQHACRMRS
jgi:hypothetical protein